MYQGKAAELIVVAQGYYCAIEPANRKSDMSLSISERIAAAFNIPSEEIAAMERAYAAQRNKTG